MRNNASRTTVPQVIGPASAVPKQPHGTDMPRPATEARTTMKAANSTDAAAEVHGKSQPAAK